MGLIKEFKQAQAEAKSCYEDPYTIRQYVIYKHYVYTMQLMHKLNMHRYKYMCPEPFDGYFKRCDWCGESVKLTRKQYAARRVRKYIIDG